MVAFVAAGGLCSCASIAAPVSLSDLLKPLDMALEQSPTDLAARAKAGDGQAQLAMSIVSRHGLNGSEQDSVGAADWMSQATSNRRILPITQYTAAFNGQPSRVNLIHVPVAAVSSAQIQAVERCIDELSRDIRSAPACGDDPAAQSARRRAWIAAGF